MPITIIFFFLTLLLLLAAGALLCALAIQSSRNHGAGQAFFHGMNAALRDSGFQTGPNRQRLEYYRWSAMPGACEEAREREQRPAMDIVDWMAEGLPGTPEMRDKCGQDCRCRLIPERRRATHHNPPG